MLIFSFHQAAEGQLEHWRLTEKGSSTDYHSSDLYPSTKYIDTQVLIVLSVNNNFVIFP